MIGAGERLQSLTLEHVRARKQFGRVIGDFQGVAHPFAAAEAELGTARDLVLLAGWRLDHDHDTISVAAARACASRAALAMGFLAHQLHGAIGFTSERGLDRWTAGIRQMSHHPPHADLALADAASDVCRRQAQRRGGP
jgi:alkylation response protein AidB-like acyl-CoA dehydrogenase